MYEKTLEFRGISRKDLISYLTSLGGKVAHDNSSVYLSENWSAVISPEQFFQFLQSDIPKVFITFSSPNEKYLQEIITNFRKKTFRIGG